ncbi:MAG TPA: hypothetical protein VNO50_19330 [Pyrinomonadaceae bacterium]|nr:hypothetical protein [Pyrinomonadaceae bacterium]
MGNKGVENRSKAPVAVLVFCALTVGLVVVHILLRGVYPPGHPIRLLVTALMVVGFASFVFLYTRLLSTMDEYQRQIQLFALAIGFPLSLVTAWGIGYFRAEGLLAGRDPRDLPLVLLIPYAVGFLAAWLKYR